MSDLNDYMQSVIRAQRKPSTSYMELLPANGDFTEEQLWEAIAEANGLDVDEIMDGDLVEWL
jgi:hypothetical protein